MAITDAKTYTITFTSDEIREVCPDDDFTSAEVDEIAADLINMFNEYFYEWVRA